MTNKNLITLLTNIDEKLDRLLEDHVHEEITFDISTTADRQLPLFPQLDPDATLTYAGRYTAKEFCMFKDLEVDRRVLGIFASRAAQLKQIPEKHKSFGNLPHPLKVWPLIIWEDAYADYKNATSPEKVL